MISYLELSDIKQNFESDKNSTQFFFPPKGKQPVISEPYRISSYALGLYHEGTIELIANLNAYPITGKNLIFLPSKVIREWQFTNVNVINSALFFERSFMVEQLGNTSFDKKIQFIQEDTIIHLKLSDANYKGLAIIFENLYQKSKQTSKHRPTLIAHELMTLLLQVDELFLETYNTTDVHDLGRNQELSKEFKRLLSKHILEQRSVSFYAEKLGINPKHLSQVLKQETGHSAIALITQKTILEAKVLLQDASMSIAQIGYALSFKNPSQFGKYFKSKTGMTPKDYRKKLLF
ncbi:helix-turn-helix domain-containing protein [Jejuia pallidilutea]|uniref:Transcriptional regulator n=1 Tax=Jejuia pallidilutea TaxID=504487 RepID=A0A090VQ60_9FLAO|nr:helix-turn-helix domain-containing protein [Jejuia pallidilutea]GAL66143.1 transcriptional regulator [Jejuia pallidilutea]GAL71089.1 transcriptional regulator [Jejuia pallidilutea]GAL88174.1 transcriptional regulator [Jejuia pallidilutea]